MSRMELHPTQQLRCSHERPLQTHPVVPQSVSASRPRSAAPRGSDRPQRAKARPHLMKARGHQAPPLAPCPTPGPSSRSQGNDVPPLTSHPHAELRRARGGMTPASGRDADASPPADGAAPRPWRRRHDVTPPAGSQGRRCGRAAPLRPARPRPLGPARPCRSPLRRGTRSRRSSRPAAAAASTTAQPGRMRGAPTVSRDGHGAHARGAPAPLSAPRMRAGRGPRPPPAHAHGLPAIGCYGDAPSAGLGGRRRPGALSAPRPGGTKVVSPSPGQAARRTGPEAGGPAAAVLQGKRRRTRPPPRASGPQPGQAPAGGNATRWSV